jgi:hypothetical protein
MENAESAEKCKEIIATDGAAGTLLNQMDTDEMQFNSIQFEFDLSVCIGFSSVAKISLFFLCNLERTRGR